jgi:hypothetical protein
MVQIDIRGNKSLRPPACNTTIAERLQSTFSWNEVVPTRGQDVGEIGHLLREASPLLKTRNAKGSMRPLRP